MFDLPLLNFLHVGLSARLLPGLGHHSAHRAGGIIFGARLLELGLAAAIAIVVASMATLSVSDWVEKRYGKAEYARVAGWIVFLGIVVLLAFAIARVV